MRFVERYFWAICIGAMLLGLFVPQACMPIARIIKWLLGTILFFTGLKLDFRAAVREIRRPWLILYATAMMMILLPLGMYLLARAVLPRPFAIGVLILAAMPAATACSSLTDIVKGNPALALVATLVTSLLCPLLTPWVVSLGSGLTAGNGAAFLLRQSSFLAMILFGPLGLAFVVRRLFPAFVRQRRELFGGLSIAALAMLIAGAMASVSADFTGLLRDTPGEAGRLFGFMCVFSVVLHVTGWFLAPWRPPADRAALSVGAAYVNNGLAIVFAVEFFKPLPGLGVAAVLPAILLEAPMTLALLPLKAWLARIARKDGEVDSPRDPAYRPR